MAATNIANRIPPVSTCTGPEKHCRKNCWKIGFSKQTSQMKLPQNSGFISMFLFPAWEANCLTSSPSERIQGKEWLQNWYGRMTLFFLISCYKKCIICLKVSSGLFGFSSETNGQANQLKCQLGNSEDWRLKQAEVTELHGTLTWAGCFCVVAGRERWAGEAQRNFKFLWHCDLRMYVP